MVPSSPPPDATHHPRTRDDVVFRQLKDEWVVLDPVADRVHVLNLTAALVWTACDGATTPEQISQGIREAFEGDLDPARIRSDVDAALEEFQREGLLQ